MKMDRYLKLDMSYVQDFITRTELEALEREVIDARATLENGTGAGAAYRGWLDSAKHMDPLDIQRMIEVAKRIRKQAKILVVIGIGGSYLGTKAALDFMRPYFMRRSKLEIIFAGHQLSSDYLADLLDYVHNKDFCLNVISKSGTTTEPAIAFRVLKKALESKYGIQGAASRIYVTTDRAKGALVRLAKENGYERFVVPDDIGGRFSVLTPVGLLPMAAAGIPIKKVLSGAKAARKAYRRNSIWDNDVHLYAAIRNALYRKGFMIEMLVNYEAKLTTFSEWWKQLFGESEGKEGKGLFVASASFSTDLHSLGQYIQEGSKILFETILHVEKSTRDIVIEKESNDLDELNYLQGKTINAVNTQAFRGTLMAHKSGGVPNIILSIPEIDAFSLGYLFYFFELSCGVSGYVLGVNPFDQPGVEAYKRNMFSLLQKPGYDPIHE